MIGVHRSDFCGLQRRQSPGFAGFEAESDTGPDVLSARDSLQPWKAESKRYSMSEIGSVIMILMHFNNVTRV